MSQSQDGSRLGANQSTPTGMPRWVKMLGIIAILVVLLVGIAMLATGGEHGPGRHLPPATTAESTAVGSHSPSMEHGG